MEFISKNEEETKKIAKNIASRLSPSVVFLNGDLGAGKTVFAKGFVSYFVPDADVVSPTFAIMNSYKDKVFHFDLYRIENEKELLSFGADEYFFSGKFCLVEWPERVGRDCFPKNVVNVKIIKVDESTRKIVVENL